MDEENKKKLTKIALLASIGGLPLFLILFTLFVTVLFVLGLLNGGNSSSGCTYISDGNTSALFDNSFTKEDFVANVNSYQAPDDSNTETGRNKIWGYETYYKPNAENFYDIATKYGLDPRFIFALSLNESEYGTSHITVDKGNLFGYGASDDNPYKNAHSFDSMKEGIETVSNAIANNYIAETGIYHKEIINKGFDPQTLNGVFSVYSTDKHEGDTVAGIMQKIFGTTTSSSSCNGNFQPLTEYNLKNKGLKKLSGTLEDDKIESLNNYIISEVNKAGYGTGGGVAAAGQSLIYGMEQFGLYLPYYWGGGHGDSASTVGISKSVGTSGKSCHNGRCYNLHSFDCSGFVSWSIRNGCKSNFSTRQSGDFRSFGNGIKLSEAKPGDIMSRDGHVMLIVKNNGDGSVVIAESTGGTDQGHIWFQTKSSAGKYKVVDMSNWYSEHCDKSR